MTKETSEEMASLASLYITFDEECFSNIVDSSEDNVARFCANVRSLAASVLSQAEPGEEPKE